MVSLCGRTVSIFCLLFSVLMLLSSCSSQSSITNTNVARSTIIVKTNTIGMKLVFLPGGTFQMGDASLYNAQPVHSVSINSFYIGQYLVTNAQFDLFKKRKRPAESLANNQPAMYVSYQDATAFCQWLSKKEKRHYYLPSEAQWEFAARGGLDQKDYPWGDEAVDGRACFNQTTSCPIGTYAPNAFGLYDMVGNVPQWVSDWYDENYYADSPKQNPMGPSIPPKNRWHILRGGMYLDFGFQCGQREQWPDDVESIAGFRVAADGKTFATSKPSGKGK